MRLKCNDFILYYKEYGQGEPLILLHGNSEDHRYFKYQIAYFQKYYHVYALDTRAHGKSTHGNKELNFDILAQDLRKFIRFKRLEKVNILGFSDGGNIALAYALRYPHTMKKLILNGANLQPNGMQPSAYRSVIHSWHLLGWLAKKSEWARKKHSVFTLMTKHPHFTEEELKKLDIPVLVIAGEKDIIRDSHTRKIAQALPQSKLIIIPGADHFCARKKPKIFNHCIIHFLTS